MRVPGAISKARVGWAVLMLGVFSFGAAFADSGIAKLREEGITAYNAGDYSQAKKAFDEALRLSPLHSLGVWAARARVKLGEWVEADAQYEKVLKAPPGSAQASSETEARQQAAREREALRHRMPRLRIRLEGVDLSEVEVSIDGAPVSDDFLIVKKSSKGIFPRGRTLEVNPGEHRLLGVSGEQRKELSVTIAEGQTRDVNMRFINPSTLRQRKCAEQCKSDCDGSNKCYVECKHRCFTKGD